MLEPEEDRVGATVVAAAVVAGEVVAGVVVTGTVVVGAVVTGAVDTAIVVGAVVEREEVALVASTAAAACIAGVTVVCVASGDDV